MIKYLCGCEVYHHDWGDDHHFCEGHRDDIDTALPSPIDSMIRPSHIFPKRDTPAEQTSPLIRVMAKVHGDRAKTYGHPAVNFRCTARMWSAYLSRLVEAGHWTPGGELPLEAVSDLNLLQKVSRLAQSLNHDDSEEDLAGFVETRWMARTGAQ